jgi:hypothetical protein
MILSFWIWSLSKRPIFAYCCTDRTDQVQTIFTFFALPMILYIYIDTVVFLIFDGTKQSPFGKRFLYIKPQQSPPLLSQTPHSTHKKPKLLYRQTTFITFNQLSHLRTSNMKATSFFVSLLPAMTVATGVFQGVCNVYSNSDVYTDYEVSKNCCAAIGGGKHFFNEAESSCQSTGGIAFHRYVDFFPSDVQKLTGV